MAENDKLQAEVRRLRPIEKVTVELVQAAHDLVEALAHPGRSVHLEISAVGKAIMDYDVLARANQDEDAGQDR
jgi:hypothetical protein